MTEARSYYRMFTESIRALESKIVDCDSEILDSISTELINIEFAVAQMMNIIITKSDTSTHV